MTWVLDHTDKDSVYWRREEDGYVIGFNRKGIGEPFSDEDKPPEDIDKYAPAVVAPEPTGPSERLITKYAFRARLTQEEKVAVELAALDDPSAPMEQRQFAAAIRSGLKDLEVAEFIDLNHPLVSQFLTQFEAIGFLARGRAAEIQGATIQPHELYVRA